MVEGISVLRCLPLLSVVGGRGHLGKLPRSEFLGLLECVVARPFGEPAGPGKIPTGTHRDAVLAAPLMRPHRLFGVHLDVADAAVVALCPVDLLDHFALLERRLRRRRLLAAPFQRQRHLLVLLDLVG